MKWFPFAALCCLIAAALPSTAWTQQAGGADRARIIDDFIAAIPPNTRSPVPIDLAEHDRLNAQFPDRAPQIDAILAAYPSCIADAFRQRQLHKLRQVAATMPDEFLVSLTRFYNSADYQKMRSLILSSNPTKDEKKEVARIGKEQRSQEFFEIAHRISNAESDQLFVSLQTKCQQREQSSIADLAMPRENK